MRCLVAEQDEGWAGLFALTNKDKNQPYVMNQFEPSNCRNLSKCILLPAYTSIFFSVHISNTSRILNCLEIA
jgi:hypothetical protein